MRKKEKQLGFLDTLMAMNLIIGMFIFPIMMFALFIDNMGSKALVILLIIVPYYGGLYKFRKGIFG